MGFGSAFKCLSVSIAIATAVAIPAAAAPGHVAGEIPVDGRSSTIYVYSPSMDRVIANNVIHAGPGAPTLYLLTGVGGAEDNISWWDNTDVRQFFAGKYVNVVMPMGGRSSMYTDWNADDPALGRNKWQTYLTEELPQAVDARFATSGVNAIVGVSMSAGPALALAIAAPHRYRAVGSFSGCPRTSDPFGIAAVTGIVGLAGGNVLNMWGPPGSPQWTAHDPTVNAGRLAGKTIVLAAGGGNPGVFGATSIAGPPVEAIAQVCTDQLAQRLAQLGIPAVYQRRAEGAHTWPLFQADLHDAWPHIGAAIGA